MKLRVSIAGDANHLDLRLVRQLCGKQRHQTSGFRGLLFRDANYREQTIADIWLRIERLFQIRYSSCRPQRKANDFYLTWRDDDGFIQVGFVVIEQENDIRRFVADGP